MEIVIDGDAELKGHITSYIIRDCLGQLKHLGLLWMRAWYKTSLRSQMMSILFLLPCFQRMRLGMGSSIGSDGFQAEFYQVFWNLIKYDLMALFTKFHKDVLPLYSLNFGTIFTS